MNTDTIGGSLLQNTHINLRIPFQKGSLSTACGLCALGSLVYLGRAIANGGAREIAAGAITFGAFGYCYKYVKKQEDEETEIQNTYELEMAKIKHPSASGKKDCTTTKESGMSQSAQHTLNESIGIEYLISPVIRKDGFTLLFGDKGSGKSILARQIAVALASGKRCSAFPEYNPSNSQKVILLDAELTKADHVDRGYNTLPNLECFACDEFNYSSIADMLKDVEHLVKKANGDCTVILDCISSSKFGLSLNSSSDMRDLDSGMKEIRKKANESGYNVNFIGINHANKSDKEVMRGCTGLIQNATCVLQISKLEGQPEFRRIQVDLNRSGKEGYDWTVQIMPKIEKDELHYEIRELESAVSTNPRDQAIGNMSQDPTYAMYSKITALKRYYKAQGCKCFWGKITAETKVTKQTYNSWEKKYGDLPDKVVETDTTDA